VVISLLASLAGLGGIGKTVKGIIAKVSKPVHRVVDRVVDKIVAFAKKVLKKGTAVAAKAKEKVLAVIQWWKESETFKSKDGGSHRVFYEGSGRKAELMVASNKDKVGPFLTKKLAQARDNDQKKAIRKAQRAYDKVLASETRLEQLETRKAAAKSESAKTTINKSIERENGKLRGALVGFSRTLEDVDFAGESDLLVKTQVSPASGSKASVVEANPLTYLPGNTVGTPPKQNPPGWAHAVKIDTDPVTHKRLSLWVRGHLLNENLHGPGESWNLVPISQKVNGEMRDGPEAKAKQAIATKGNVIYYRTSVTFHDGKAPVSDFPKKIHVTWGYLERVPGSAPPTFTRKSGTEKRVPFGPLDLPPATAADIKYNINKIGRPLLVELTGVSVRFGLYVLEEKDRAKDFRSYEDFAARMMKYQKREGKDEAVFNAYLQGIKDAENAGKLVFK